MVIAEIKPDEPKTPAEPAAQSSPDGLTGRPGESKLPPPIEGASLPEIQAWVKKNVPIEDQVKEAGSS